jgi:hypothetical protein
MASQANCRCHQCPRRAQVPLRSGTPGLIAGCSSGCSPGHASPAPFGATLSEERPQRACCQSSPHRGRSHGISAFIVLRGCGASDPARYWQSIAPLKVSVSWPLLLCLHPAHTSEHVGAPQPAWQLQRAASCMGCSMRLSCASCSSCTAAASWSATAPSSGPPPSTTWSPRSPPCCCRWRRRASGCALPWRRRWAATASCWSSSPP